MDVAVANTRAARALVRGLARAGVRHVCITPGSRSTPLTVAFAEQSVVRPWLHLDERSSAFFALGLARALGSPVAVVCTSGTAAANLHPAIAEANLSRIPLVVLTADRPPALRDVGAAQTIDQVRLFGTATRWAADLPLPTEDDADIARFEAYAERAARLAAGAPARPVHLNVPFDEPLLASPTAHPSFAPPPAAGTVQPTRVDPSATDVEAVARLLATSERPLIVAGPETGGLPAEAVAELARRLDAPVLADPLSGLRFGPHDRTRVLDSYDAAVRDPRARVLAPDVVIRLGAVPTSKALGQFIASAPGAAHVLLDDAASWRDPFSLTTALLPGDVSSALTALAAALPARAARSRWLESWLAVDRRAREAMQARCAGFDEPFEGRVFPELQSALPDGATLVVGNSMPVRDADAFLVSDPSSLVVVGNRGANGIDGVVSSALGAAAAGRGPVTLVIGDLSFYHDMNGLWAANRHGIDLSVVLVNNGGGAIFHYLPQSAHTAVFEEWFATPSGLDFGKAAELYGARYVRAADWQTFREGIDGALSARGLAIVEVPADRAANVAMHRAAWAAAAAAAWEQAPVAP